MAATKVVDMPMEATMSAKATPVETKEETKEGDFDISTLRKFNAKEVIIENPEAIVSNLAHECKLEDLLIKPNVDDSKELTAQIMQIVNVAGLAPYLSSVGSTVIDPGMLGIISHNGAIEVAGPGRWAKLNPRASWVKFVNLTDAYISYGSLTIIRIPKGQYGLAVENGKALILAEGMHVRNSRMFMMRKDEEGKLTLKYANSEVITNGTISIIRVPVGFYGKVLENNVPKLLRSGNYATDSNYFTYAGSVSIDSDHIEYNMIHVVRVPKASMTFCRINNKPAMLKEGTYTFNIPQFKLDNTLPLVSESISYTSITRFFVKQGQIAKAWYRSKPIFITAPGIYEIDDTNFVFVECVPSTTKIITLGSRNRFIVYAGEIGLALENNVGKFFDTPGIYERDDPNFVFKECVPLSTNKISIGSKMRIIVRDGEVGESYLSGNLDILKPGVHVFDTNERVFKNFIPKTQQCVDLGDEKTGLSTFDTVEFVPIGVKAEIFYTIEKPEIALVVVGDEKMIKKRIKDTGLSTLNSIMRSTPLNKVSQSKVINTKGEREIKMGMDPFSKSSEPLIFDQIHDKVIAKMHDTFMEKYGLNIANIQIGDFQILNKELVKNISDNALTTAKTETERANLEGIREIKVAQQDQEAMIIKLKAHAEADRLKTETESKTKSSIMNAEAAARENSIRIGNQAEAEASRILTIATAEAKSIELKAGAEAKAIELMAAAEKKRAEALASTDIGGRLAMMKVQADAAAKCFEKTDKVFYYIPAGTGMGGMSSGLFGLPGMPMMSLMPERAAAPAAAPHDLHD
ncbi:MAG: prohibitin domain-containing protein [Harvfovirus sp.]|uniref:Prohibitin domain-containing protein n=1 Tax=Harvfovirus sp. TaxID=2487768 RepID=A0A3G5A4K1_9VIRU|nr:MAG: prohibitin domain-containing protein [Harvfovirus sp.]